MTNAAAPLGRLKEVLVSQETEWGEAVAGATSLWCYDPTLNPENDLQERPLATSFMGRTASMQGRRAGKASLRTELRSNGTSALDAAISIMLQACGLVLTTGVYAPDTSHGDAHKTATIDVYSNGRMKQLSGAMAEMEISAEAGRIVMLNFEAMGSYVPAVDAELPGSALPTILPMRLASATLSLGSWSSPKISRISLKLGNALEPREDAAAASGVAHFMIGRQDASISMDPEAVLCATHDVEAAWSECSEGALSLLLTDGKVNVTIAAPKVQYVEVPEGTRDSKAVYELVGQINDNAGDDFLTITVAAHGV